MEVTTVASGRVMISDGVHNIMLDDGYMLLNEESLKRYCNNARAYGWEAGFAWGSSASAVLKSVYDTNQYNPFVNPDWDKHLKLQGFLVTAKENQL